MTAPNDGTLSNETPDILVAVFMHRRVKAEADLGLAKNAVRLLDAQAVALNLPLAGMKRAAKMMTADPERLERQERETAFVLRALKADVEVEQPSLFESTTDESDADRSVRMRRAGWFAAVLGQPRDGGGHDDEQDLIDWTEGYDGFLAELAAYEALETKQRRRSASAG